MIKIIIADDHSFIREGLKKVIANEINMKVVGEAADYNEIMNITEKAEFDLLILDITLPGKNGIDAIIDLKKLYDKIKIIVLTMHPVELFAVRAFKAGAKGYLTKECSTEELLKAIETVYKNNNYISNSFANALADTFSKKDYTTSHESLSNREFQILQLIASGKTIKEIADYLSLSQSTINTYRNRILEKLNLNSNVDIIHYAIRNKIINIE